MTVTDAYNKIYGDTYTSEINKLKEMLLEKSHPKIRVFSLEAGGGKSTILQNTINEQLGWMENKYIVVKPFTKDIMEFYDKVPDDYKRSVLPVTSGNWESVRNDLKNLHKYDVVLITHERYRLLCRKSNQHIRKHFIEGRDVLVVDEKVDFPCFTVSKDLEIQLRRILHHQELKTELDKMFSKLENIIEEYDQKVASIDEDLQSNQVGHVYRRIQMSDAKFEKFLEKVKAKHDSREKVQDIEEKLEHIKGVYQADHLFYNDGNLAGVNLEYGHWNEVPNTIILDATGSIDHAYKSSDRFEVLDQERFIDYSKSKLHLFTNFKASMGHIGSNSKAYFKQMAEYIKCNENEGRILIITHKRYYPSVKENLLMNGCSEQDIFVHEDQEEPISDAKIVINWFGNVVGSNSYQWFKQCYILGLPHLPFHKYVSDFIIHRSKPTYQMGMKFNRGKFKNGTFRNIQNSFLTKELYQAMKRVGRDPLPEVEWYVVLDDKEIRNELTPMFKNIQESEEELHIEETKKKRIPNHEKLFAVIQGQFQEGHKKQLKTFLINEAGISKTNFSKTLHNIVKNGLVEEDQIKNEGRDPYIYVNL